MIPPETHRKTVIVNYKGVKIKVTVLAYCDITNEMVESCFGDYVRSLGKKKPKPGTELIFKTLYGVSNPL